MSEPMSLHGDPDALTGGEGNPADPMWPNETVPPAIEIVTTEGPVPGFEQAPGPFAPPDPED